MAVASLTLRIAADLNSFSRDLKKMTRQVDEAAEHITKLGKTLTLGITAPVGLALAALAKMGVENEETANRMRRSFGDAADEVTHRLEQLMTIAPETGDALSAMAIDMNDVATGMGFGKRQATQLSTSMLQLAADVAAFRNVGMDTALEGLTKGLQGQTRGLKTLGIALDAADVKQEAYRLGLLQVGQELTPLGTALATYSLLVQRTGHMSGEAGRRKMDLARQMKFLKRDLIELADRLGNLLVPALRVLTGMARVVVDALSKIPNWFWILAGSVATAAAAMGPLLIVSGNLVAIFYKLRAAIILLTASEALPRLILLLRTLAKDPKVWATMLAIAGAVALATWAFNKFRKGVEDTGEALADLADVGDLLGGITGDSTDNPLQALQKQAQSLITAFDQSMSAGAGVAGIFDQIVSLNERVLRLYDAQSDKLSEMALTAQDIALRTRAIMETSRVASALMRGDGADAVKSASRALLPVGQIRMDVAASAIQEENTLRLREMLLSLQLPFDATRIAAIEFGEGLRRGSQDFAVGMASFKLSWRKANIADGALAGLQAAFTPLLAAMTPVALMFTMIGKVLEPIMPLFSALLAPLVELGRVLGILLLPILRLLFIPLKYLAIIVAWLGEIIARVVAGIATAVGGVIKAIGKAIDALPLISAKGVIKAGQAMLDFGKGAYDTADQLNKARKEIQRMQFGDTADDIDQLGDAARDTAEALLNIPDGFKVALAQFKAQLPGERPRVPGSGGGLPNIDPPDGPGGFGEDPAPPKPGTPTVGGPPTNYNPIGGFPGRLMDQPLVIQLALDGKVIATKVVKSLEDMAVQQFGNPARWPEVVSG